LQNSNRWIFSFNSGRWDGEKILKIRFVSISEGLCSDFACRYFKQLFESYHLISFLFYGLCASVSIFGDLLVIYETVRLSLNVLFFSLNNVGFIPTKSFEIKACLNAI
jgi:hypothetical protein